MNDNPLKDGALTENSVGLGTVNRKMVRARAVQLAALDGRPATATTKSDRDQARRELTGRTAADPKETALESVPEAERWDPVPGSTGGKVAVNPSADEDEEGRSDNERLVAEGMAGAEDEQTRAAAKADRQANS